MSSTHVLLPSSKVQGIIGARSCTGLAHGIVRANLGVTPLLRQRSALSIITCAASKNGVAKRLAAEAAARNMHVNAAAVLESVESETESEAADREQLERMLASDRAVKKGHNESPEADLANLDPTLLLENNGLSDVTIRALHGRGIKSLFPIQKAVFQPAMEGQDLIARARTGSGKTLAFSLPIIEKILAARNGQPPRKGRRPQCLVLAPTRELAQQVFREIEQSAPTLEVGCYYGGSPYPAQERQLRSGVDIVTGTPGRIIDLIDRNCLDLSELRFAVLDEADQMLNVGFDKDVEQILSTAPEEGRQTLLFSATMPKWVKNLTRRFQTNPLTVDLVGDQQTGKMAESIRALAVQVPSEARRSVLVDILTVYAVRQGGGLGKAIVFTQTKRDADEVAAAISHSLACEPLHGDISQSIREKVLKRFRDSKFSVLVATDVAARGLDIPDVDLVVHYELPQEPESFLHRSGRTGRAGRSGTTIAMFTPREVGYFKRILRETETTNIEYIPPPSPKQVMHASAQQVVHRLTQVDSDVQQFFMPAAKLILSSENPEMRMAAALAALSGRSEVPQPRSLITMEEGQVTLQLLGEPGELRSIGQVLGVMRKIAGGLPEGAFGRARMLVEGDKEGAAFDVKEDLADAVLAKAGAAAEMNFQLTRPSKLPPPEDSGRDSGDRGFGRGGRGGNGRGSFGGRGGGRREFGGRSDFGGGRTSSWGDRGRGGAGGRSDRGGVFSRDSRSGGRDSNGSAGGSWGSKGGYGGGRGGSSSSWGGRSTGFWSD